MSNPFDIGSALSRAWNVFTANAVPLIIGILLVGLLSLVTLGFAAPGLLVGYNKMVLRAVRGEDIEIGDVFEGFSFFVPALLMGIVVGLGVSVGMMLLVIPGLFLLVLWYWVWLLMADGAEGLGDVLKKSGEITKSNLGGAIIFILVAGIVSAAGSVIPGGGLVTGPLSMAMTAVAYDEWVKANG